MRIGLLGGSFNPIHTCHIVIAKETRERLALDQILFIPTGDPPHKPRHSLASSEDRLEMVRLAIAEYSYFQVSDLEARSPHTSYTIDTIQTLRKRMSPTVHFFFIVGLDAFLDFPTWKRADELLLLTNFVVVSRPERQFADLRSLKILPAVPSNPLIDLDKGLIDQFNLSTSPQTQLILLRLAPCPISASAVRDRLQGQMPITDWLPPPVESYIIQHHLYKKG